MINYYKLFNIDYTATENEILNAYKNAIRPYSKLINISLDQKQDIKNFKVGLHILLNKELRTKYDIRLNNSDYKALNSNCSIDNSSIELDYQDQTLDTNLSHTNKITDSRKNKIPSNILSDRIFSTTALYTTNTHNPQIYNIDLRKQQQTRLND